MGITKNHEIFAEKEFEGCFTKLLQYLIDDDTEIVTVYYGKDLSEFDCQVQIAQAETMYPDIEFDMYDGGQPLYPVYISAE